MQTSSTYSFRFWWNLYRPNIRETLKLSYPIVIAQLGIVLMSVADTVQIGEIGATPLAAAGVANGIFFLISILGIGILSVVAPLIATAQSQNENDQCGKILGSALQLSVCIGIFILFIVSILAYFFHFLQQKPEVEEIGVSYLIILAVSAIPMMIFLAARNFTDGLSYTKVSMYVTFFGVFINVLLNWILIHGKFGFPRLLLDGAGYATLLTRMMMTLIILGYVFKSSIFKPYLVQFNLLRIEVFFTSKILRLGIPSGLQYFFEVASFVGAVVMSGWLGVNQLAAHQIAINLSSVTYMIASGFGSAGSIRVGYAQGEKNAEKTLQNGNTAFLITIIFMGLCCLVFILFNDALVRLYINDSQVIRFAVILVIIAGFFQLADGIQVVALGNLRGLQDVNIPTYITLFAYWVIGIPTAYLLGFYTSLDIYGVWIGLSIGLYVSAVLLTFRFYKMVRLKKRFVLKKSK